MTEQSTQSSCDYGKRLADAMQRAGLTQEQLASKAGIKQPSIQYLLTKASGSKHTTKFAEICGVSAGWLATGDERVTDTFAERLKSARNDAKVTQEKLAEIVGVSKQMANNWENRGDIPSPDKLIKICDYFDVDLRYMVTGVKGKTILSYSERANTDLELVAMEAIVKAMTRLNIGETKRVMNWLNDKYEKSNDIGT